VVLRQQQHMFVIGNAQQDAADQRTGCEIEGPRGLFGGDVAGASAILADETGIELLIARLEELDEETSWDA